MQEFKVNEYITLKLENNQTIIYVNGQRFDQCKFLLLNIPIDEIRSFDEIESIDEAEEELDHLLEPTEVRVNKIPPETEFWGHCSNLQVWYENNYDTRLLHRFLAFPLLRKLSYAGDSVAKRVFKEEIAKRLLNSPPSVITFLVQGNYLEIFNAEEILTILEEKCDIKSRAVLLMNLYKKEFYKEYAMEKIENFTHKDLLEILSSDLGEVKEDLLNYIKKKNGLDFIKKIILDLLNKGNPNSIVYLFSEVTYELSVEDRVFFFERSNTNIFEILDKAIKKEEYIVESLLYFFYEDESEIRKSLIPLIKRTTISSFKTHNLDAIFFLTQFKLIYCFDDNELIELIKNPELSVIKDLMKLSTYPPLASYDYFNIESTVYVLQYFFHKLEQSIGDILIKELTENLKIGGVEFLNLVITHSFYGWDEFEYDYFYEYLEKNDIELLFCDPNSKMKINLLELLKRENKGEEYYIIIFVFMIWIYDQIGEQYIRQFFTSLTKEDKDHTKYKFSYVIKYLSNPKRLDNDSNRIKLKEFVLQYYNLLKEDPSEEVKYVETHGEKFFIQDDTLNRTSWGRIKRIVKISDIKGLQKYTELKELYLDMNHISEIEGLDNFVNLEVLSLRNNRYITEIKGLDKLTKLRVLRLDGNSIDKIKGLDNLKNLEVLWLGFNRITEINGLDKLLYLQDLRFESNIIGEIKNIEHLKHLKDLRFYGNKIKEIKNLDSLTELENLDLRNNQFYEIKGLKNLINLKNLFISDDLIPRSLINQLGGMNRNHQVNNAQKFVEYCRQKEE